MTRNLINGAAYNILNIMIQIFLGMLVFREMYINFGEHDFGMWMLVFAVMTQITLFEFGLGSIVSKLTPILKESEINTAQFSTALFAILLIGAFFFLILAISSFVFSLFPDFAKFDGNITLAELVFLLGANFVFTFQSVAAQAYLNGKFKLGVLNAIKVVVSVVRSVGILIGLGYGLGIFFVGIAFACSSFLQLAAMLFISHKIGLFNDFRLSTCSAESWNQIKLLGSRFMFININNYLRNNAAVVVCGLVLGAVAVVPLRIAGRLIEIYVQLSAALITMLTPYFSTFSANNSEALRKSFRISLLASSSMAALIFINIYFLSSWFINLWLGEVPEGTLDVLIILSGGFLLANSQGPCTPLMISKDQGDSIMSLCLIEICLVIILIYPMVLAIGIIGSAYATIIALVISRGVIQPFLVSRLLPISLSSYFISVIIPILTVIVIVSCLYYASSWFDNNITFLRVASFILLQLIAAIALAFLLRRLYFRRDCIHNT
ncbi:polysaccharide biosynthesis protein [Alteromonas mediterranea 615]|uniref:Polysaccharide biosynthesis protein n=1 Tax=Alteromonas mediterranea 615 TaxID=1300253 RepID=S5AM62_9ALTE|nr:polysaccharide biosynthesis protein [Alteromonas mediterranea 615]